LLGAPEDESTSAAVAFLMENSLVQRLDDNNFSMSSRLMLHGVALSNAVLESSTRADRSTYEFRNALRRRNWTNARDARTASVEFKRFIKTGCDMYFSLLYNFGDIVLCYEEKQLFSHSQSNAYYNCLEAAIIINIACEAGGALKDMLFSAG
jgi:hypothetical protein